MRLNKREIRDINILKEIVENCTVVRLGILDEEGMFIVPVNYGYEFAVTDGTPELTLYIHGAKEGRKARAFAASSSVAIEMDEMKGIITGDYTCSYSCSYRSIMGNGTIHLLDKEEEIISGLTRIMAHMAPDADIDFRPGMTARTNVYRIDVTEFTGKERKTEHHSCR